MRETCEQRRQESQDNYRVVLIGLVVRSSSGPWISYRFPPASRQYYHTDSHQPSTSLPKSSPSKRFRQQEGLLSDHDRFESSMGVTYSQLHTETDRTCLLVGRVAYIASPHPETTHFKPRPVLIKLHCHACRYLGLCLHMGNNGLSAIELFADLEKRSVS